MAYDYGFLPTFKLPNTAIKVEIRRLKTLHGDTRLGNKTCCKIWKMLSRRCKLRSKSDPDIQELDHQFFKFPGHFSLQSLFLVPNEGISFTEDSVRKSLLKIKDNMTYKTRLIPLLFEACGLVLWLQYRKFQVLSLRV